MLTRRSILEHRAGGIRVFGFQPAPRTPTCRSRYARRHHVISKIPREHLPGGHSARGIVYLCTKHADDLAGKESACAMNFRRRIGLAD